MSDIAPLEIRALVKIIDELDYYQILHLERDAPGSDVKRAFHASSRTFHPDTNRHLGDDLQDGCQRISKRLTEAYCVLRDPRRRRSYDARISNGEGTLRIQLAEARTEHSKRDQEERQGKTPQGRQFFQRAIQDLNAGNTAGAISNLQMAITFEPGNAGFVEQLEEIRKSR